MKNQDAKNKNQETHSDSSMFNHADPLAALNSHLPLKEKLIAALVNSKVQVEEIQKSFAENKFG